MAGDNPRVANGAARRRVTARLKARRDRCALCLGAIDYTLDTWTDPRDGKAKRHPMSFEVDEIRPVKLWEQYGYASKTAAAIDPDNVQASHRFCNQWRGARSMRWVEAHRRDLRAELTRRGYARWPSTTAPRHAKERKRPKTSRDW